MVCYNCRPVQVKFVHGIDHSLNHLDIDVFLTSEYIYRSINIHNLPVCNASEQKASVSDSEQYLLTYCLSLLCQQQTALKMSDEVEDLDPKIEEGTKEEEAVLPQDEMYQALEWVGFTLEYHRQAIIEEGFDTFVEFSSNSIKDISDLAYSFRKITVADGRITFGLRQNKRIKAMIYWSMDFQQCSKQPTTAPLNQLTFLQALETASSQEDMRNQESD